MELVQSHSQRIVPRPSIGEFNNSFRVKVYSKETNSSTISVQLELELHSAYLAVGRTCNNTHCTALPYGTPSVTNVDFLLGRA